MENIHRKKGNTVVSTYRVVERFISLNGEAARAGELAVFIRFAGCNLDCGYCDTKWANEAGVPYEELTEDEIIDYVRRTKVKNVTLTGGEPLIQKDIDKLLLAFELEDDVRVEIENKWKCGYRRVQGSWGKCIVHAGLQMSIQRHGE